MVQVVPFTGTLANTREHGDAAVLLRDVVDHFHEDNGLAHARAAEQAHLAALGERDEQVNDLDAGFEQFHLGVLLGELRRRTVNGQVFVGIDGAHFVNGTPHHVHDATKRRLADRHHDGLAGVHRFHAAHETFGRVHGDGADDVVAEVLGNFADQLGRVAVVGVLDVQRAQDVRQVAARELDVHDGADDLNDLANVSTHVCTLPY
ncbi:hypothetical protein DSECCO2_583690 [anaerobic digester metagenome]